MVHPPAIIGTDWPFASCNSPSWMHSCTAGLGLTVSDIHTAETLCLSRDWSRLLDLFCLQPLLEDLLLESSYTTAAPLIFFWSFFLQSRAKCPSFLHMKQTGFCLLGLWACGGLEAELATGLCGWLLYAPLLSFFGLLDAMKPLCASMYYSAYLVTSALDFSILSFKNNSNSGEQVCINCFLIIKSTKLSNVPSTSFISAHLLK